MLYFVIPTINGEIDGHPFVYNDKYEVWSNVDYECVIYEIDIVNLLIREFHFC